MDNKLVQDFLNLSLKDRQEILNATREEEKKEQEKRIRDFSRDKEALYKGKCYKKWGGPSNSFPDMWGYYKILNFRYKGNQNLPEALFFSEYPLYWYDYKMSLAGAPGDYFLGETNFDGIAIVAVHDFLVPFDKFGHSAKSDNFIEISIEEYNDAMRLYTERLINLDFICDHYRGTNVRPDEGRWKIK